MGSGIAASFVQAGFEVVLVDTAPGALSSALQRVQSILDRAVQKGRIQQDDRDACRTKIRGAGQIAAIGAADLVIEAVFEDLGVKRDVFAELGRLAKPQSVLATNTSALDVSAIARASGRQADVIGMHFFSPAHVMRLVEIVRTPESSREALATALDVTRRIGKIGVVVGNRFGFVGNRMLYAYGREKELMMLEGAAPEQIDAALEGFGMAMGPNAVGDLAGLDVGVHARKQWKDRPDDPRFYRVSDMLVERGRLGQKNGRGFYRYVGPERRRERDPEVLELIRAESRRLGVSQREIPQIEIVERCMLALINEGARLLEERVASAAADIDLIWCNGYGFPRERGGPMAYADTLGLPAVIAAMAGYRARHGARDWTPAPLLERLSRAGRRLSEWRVEGVGTEATESPAAQPPAARRPGMEG